MVVEKAEAAVGPGLVDLFADPRRAAGQLSAQRPDTP
jgi:hypothetical protein